MRRLSSTSSVTPRVPWVALALRLGLLTKTPPTVNFTTMGLVSPAPEGPLTPSADGSRKPPESTSGRAGARVAGGVLPASGGKGGDATGGEPDGCEAGADPPVARPVGADPDGSADALVGASPAYPASSRDGAGRPRGYRTPSPPGCSVAIVLIVRIGIAPNCLVVAPWLLEAFLDFFGRQGLRHGRVILWIPLATTTGLM